MRRLREGSPEGLVQAVLIWFASLLRSNFAELLQSYEFQNPMDNSKTFVDSKIWVNFQQILFDFDCSFMHSAL